MYQSRTGKGTVHFIFDLTGYFVRDANGATFVPLNPARVVDSRIKQGIGGSLSTNRVYPFAVAGLGGVPASAIAVAGNATATT